MPRNLFYAVTVHDMEYLITDTLPFTTATERAHDQRNKFPAPVLADIDAGELQGEAVLRVAQLARFCIIIALPVELPQKGIAHPYKYQGQSIGIAPYPVEQIVAEVEPVHQGP
jgi:hypothetical protein